MAGGVLRLRSTLTSPSTTTIPIPGKSPNWMLASKFFPAECWALSISTKVAGRPGATSPPSSLRIFAVFPVAKQKATSAGISPNAANIEIIRKIPRGCTPDPAGESVPRITRSSCFNSFAVRSVSNEALSFPLCTISSARVDFSQSSTI